MSGTLANIDFAAYHDLVQLYADYAYAVDSGDWDLWPEFFVEDCRYRLVPRENHERGLPLATLSFESKPFHRTLAELGGREVGDTDHMVTETLIRGMYRYWREVMEA